MWENPGADRDLIAQAKDGKWGATGRGKSDTGSREELLGLTSRGGKRRRAVEAGIRGCLPGGRLLCAWEKWGRRSGCKEIEKCRQRVKYEGR